MPSITDYKSKGNEAFKDGDFQTAVDMYSEAIHLLRTRVKHEGDADGLRVTEEDRTIAAVLYSNKSAAEVRLGRFQTAAGDATEATRLDPNYAKAFFRLGTALMALGKKQDASLAFEQSKRITASSKRAVAARAKNNTSSGFSFASMSLYSDKPSQKQQLPARLPEIPLFGEDCLSLGEEVLHHHKGLSEQRVGRVGLLNLGNTCYINSVLQVLFHTPPLVALLEHIKPSALSLADAPFDMLVELEVLLKQVEEKAERGEDAIAPKMLIKHLRTLSKEFRHYAPEDAHMFWCTVVEAMQKSCLYGFTDKVTPLVEMSTLLFQLFGMKQANVVRCKDQQQCGYTSKSEFAAFELHFDAVNVAKGEALTLPSVVETFTKAERIDDFTCEKCNGKGIDKSVAIVEPPNILTITVQRCGQGMFGKSNVYVELQEELDLAEYVESSLPCKYSLYAVLVHLDLMNSTFHGHYISYCKDSFGRWWCFDDEKVYQVDWEKDVKPRNAMMLFFRKQFEEESS